MPVSKTNHFVTLASTFKLILVKVIYSNEVSVRVVLYHIFEMNERAQVKSNFRKYHYTHKITVDNGRKSQIDPLEKNEFSVKN